MGGICVKPSGGSPWERSSKREESFRVKNRGEVRTGSLDKRLNNSNNNSNNSNSRRVRVRDDHFDSIITRTIPKGEQVVAGWPYWLTQVAAEAINGWLPRKADTFEKLDKIGQGTYSNVYKARDLVHNKIVALKRVRFDNKDLDSVLFMAREIVILRRLDHPNVIKLQGLITSRTSSTIYLVFEYMEHDLTGLVSLPGIKFTEPQVKCYMKQLLSGLDHCHTHGVLHRDIKGSNLLIDNNGILKIADFGLANFFSSRQSVPLTSRVVTLWYRPPELLLGATRYGVSVDLWSAGCILGELYAGKPIMPGRTEVEQLHKIFKLCGSPSPSDNYWMKSKLPHSTVFKPTQPYKRRIIEAFKDFPSAAIALMETLLAIEPQQRGTAALALKSEFFTTEPNACDPSSLPQYPPSKEIDAKKRDDEVKRQRAAAGKGENKEPKERSSMPAAKTSKDKVKLSPPMRESYSGPLVAVAGPTRNKTAQPTNYQSGKLSESAQEFMHHRNNLPQNMAGPCRIGSGRATNMDGEGYKGNKIQFSGPLASLNVDQVLKDHDRRIQEAARRSRLAK